MLKSKLHHFHDLIGLYGQNVPVIAKAIIERAFPETFESADREGCEGMLFEGVKGAVSRYIRKRSVMVADQPTFDGWDEAVREAAAELKSSAYTVPSTGEAVSVARLVANPDLLDEARKFMRQKGMECLAEAKRLDDLYGEVLRAAKTQNEAAE